MNHDACAPPFLHPARLARLNYLRALVRQLLSTETPAPFAGPVVAGGGSSSANCDPGQARSSCAAPHARQ